MMKVMSRAVLPGVAIASCNDGHRPVIMKREATDEESKLDYESVER